MDHLTRADLEAALSHPVDRVLFKLALGAARDAAEAKGRARGQARGRVEGILIVLEARQIRLTDQQRDLLEGTTDRETLHGWLLAAIHAESGEGVFS